MKIVKKLMTALLGLVVVAAAVMIPNTAKAAGETYTVHWNGSEWFFQRSTDSTWLNVESIDNFFSAGDHIIVDGEGKSGLLTCNITVSKLVGDACATGGATVIVNSASGTTQAYAAGNGTTIINGNVDTVVASGAGVVQVNGNVNVLIAEYNNGDARYGITGTVNKATAKINSQQVDTYYAIAANKMFPDSNGIVWLADGQFSRTPVDGGSVINTPATTAPAGNANNQLDEVPKTGSFVFEISIVLLAAAVVFGVASAVVLRKKTR